MAKAIKLDLIRIIVYLDVPGRICIDPIWDDLIQTIVWGFPAHQNKVRQAPARRHDTGLQTHQAARQ